MSLYLGTMPIAVNSSSRNIGEIIASTIPLSDAGLHLLDGSLISGSGSYSAFVMYISGLVSSFPDLFETEANWQSSVTAYGVCGKFVYDSVNNTVRLPRITGFTEGTIDPTVLGNLTQAGLPNITGNSSASGVGNVVEPDGCFYNGSSATVLSGSTGTYARNSFDASLSSSIYGNSTTVQPQSIKVLYYIVIATSVKANIEVDIDEVMTDLNGKADVDLSNCTSPIVSAPYIVETYHSGTDWYRVWSDGWCEQGGYYDGTANTWDTVPFLKSYISTPNVSMNRVGPAGDDSAAIDRRFCMIRNITNSSFSCWGVWSGYKFSWRACGYIS